MEILWMFWEHENCEITETTPAQRMKFAKFIIDFTFGDSKKKRWMSRG